MLGFVLKKLHTGADIVLSESKEYVVGRKDCDIVILGDNSISRKHAILKVTENSVSIVDCGAKYQTFVNDEKLEPNEETLLKLKDIVRFGIINSKYMLQMDFSKFKYVTATSGIGSQKKEALKKTLKNCGGLVVDNWYEQCTHLTVEKLLLTEKVLEALIDGKPFVVPEYWTALEKFMKGPKLKEPDINKYNKPPVAESVNIDSELFVFKEERKSLFKDKIFVFATKQGKNRLNSLIIRCGGECQAWEENPLILYEVQISPKTHIIISTDKSQVPGFSEFIQGYQKQNKRTIPLNEIAMAVVKCSTEQDCNPEFDKANHIFGNRLVSQKQPDNDGASKMVPETESVFFDTRSKQSKDEDIVFPMTLPPTFETNLGDSQYLNQPSTSGIRTKSDVIVIDDDDDDDDYALKVSKKQKIEHKTKKMKTEKVASNHDRHNTQEIKTDAIDIEEHHLFDEKTQNIKTEEITVGKRSHKEEGNENVKKIKLDVGVSQKEKEENNVLNKSMCRTQDFIKISSKKRKAIELAAELPTHTKRETNTSTNPFAQMKKSLGSKSSCASSSNPFEKLKKRIKPKETVHEEEELAQNPFTSGKILDLSSKLNCTFKNKENFNESQVDNDAVFTKKEANAKKNDNSTFVGANSTRISVFGSSWISKNFSHVHVEKVKQEDPQLSKIIEMFKDCIKVKPLTIPQREKYVDRSANNSTLDVTDGTRKPNFKRFKKVLPLHPQINIITRNQLIKVGPGRATENNDDEESEQDSC